MLLPIFAAIVLTQVGVFAIPLDERILEHGLNGTTVVLLAVATIEQFILFPDDNGMLHRIAYVEMRDGTLKPFEHAEYMGRQPRSIATNTVVQSYPQC